MKILEKNNQRIVMRQRSSFAAIFSLLILIIFGNLAYTLRHTAPVQQTYLMAGLSLFGFYLFYQSMRTTTIKIDLLRNKIHWRERSLLRTRQAVFSLRDIENVKVDTIVGSHRRRARWRHRPQMEFKDHTKTPPFFLTPHHLPGPGAQIIADEINTVLSTHVR